MNNSKKKTRIDGVYSSGVHTYLPIFDNLEVRVWIKGASSSKGLFSASKDGIHIKLDSGKVVSEKESHDVYYEMDKQILPEMNGGWEAYPLEEPVRIQFKPRIVIYRTYAHQGGQYIEDVFPPSTSGFYGRLKSGFDKHLYIVQEIKGNSKLWLTITNPITGQIYEAHSIFPYEAEALSIISSQEFRSVWYQDIWSTFPSSQKEEIRSILDSPSVIWKEFAKILGDISLPTQKLGETMRDTLTPLIPPSFPTAVQEQLMLFLAFVLKKEITLEDPIDYLYKFWSFPILAALLEGHLMCIAENVEFPPYLKLLTQAGRKDLIAPTRAIPQSVVDSPWLLFWQKTMEQFPNWFDLASDIVNELNVKGKIIDKLPITAAAAKKSTKDWKKRLAILMYELRIVGRVNQKTLGLSKLVYLGSAYRWPHRHMEFITRLGSAGDSTPYLHVMIMPPSAATQVKRALPSAIDVALTARTSNISLFDKKKKTWEIPTDRIITSIEKNSSLKKLTNRFHVRTDVSNYSLNQEEAKVLDLASEGIRLGSIEREEYLAPWGFNSKTVQTLLTDLSDRDIIKIYYEASNQNLFSLATVIHGPPDRVASLCSTFLDYTPTTLMMLGETGEQSILLTRLPEASVYELSSKLPPAGMEHGLTIRCLRPTTFHSYTHSLYQRLLKEDGTWDDDVSAFLSQARSKRKELSESNA
jgi:hypothetical protein